MTDTKLSTESPKIRPAWWAWLLAISCFAITLLANIRTPQHFLPFAVLGVGAGITVLQCSRIAKIPRKTRVAFCLLVAATAWVAFLSIGAFAVAAPPAGQ